MEKKLPLYEMMIGDTIEGEEEVDFIALVEYPAIQKNFLAFKNQEAFESYADYPEGVRSNAKKVLEYTEENGWGSCGTPVGKQRANQLANGEPISVDTIKRMYSYLSRHEVDLESSASYGDGCGLLMYDAWGGKAALGWSRNKLRELGELEEQASDMKFSIQDEEQKIVTGPLMIADLPIYRRDEDEEYYVSFSAAEIKKIVQRFFKKGYQSKVNVEHSTPVDGVYMFESFIIDREKGIMPPKGFEDVSNGSWFGSFKVDNEKIWNEVKAGTFKGFSVEGLFRYEKTNKVVTQEEQIMQQIFKILSQIEH
jgi:Putative phage serine protease XkdF